MIKTGSVLSTPPDSYAMNPTSANIDVLELTVAQIQAAFESGAMTSEALTSAYLERIAQVNPRYNAFIFMNPQALDDARAIDRRRASGAHLDEGDPKGRSGGIGCGHGSPRFQPANSESSLPAPSSA